MKSKTPKQPRVLQPGRLTSARGEKISAVEGMMLTPRMRAVLDLTKDKSGDERRKMIQAQFARKSV